MIRDNLIQVLSVTLLGILVVFSVLIILMFVLAFMKFFSTEEKKEAKTEKKEEKVTAAIDNIAIKKEDEDELIAVLAAAIAASLGTSVSSFKIRSYRRLKSKN